MSIALHTDLYQLNMGYSYFLENRKDDIGVFEVYYRTNPFEGCNGIFVGSEKIKEIVANFTFDEEDIIYLKETQNYNDDYLNYLRNFKFSGNIYSCLEGEVIFANEPILVVEAPIIEGQIIETIILNIINFQTLVATRAAQIVTAADGDKVFEFGARRAHETEAALWGTRSAYIAGFAGTSLVEAGRKFKIPVVGTHSHSFVQSFETEKDAFLAYARHHKNSTFLVDTYDVINSGIPNAIEVAKTSGCNLKSIRLDSGDLAKLSKECRKLLDNAGLKETQIIASNDLDADLIFSLKSQNAKIDSWGVGTKVITCFKNPSLGAVYKLVKINDRDVIKVSASIDKTTVPCFKQVYRLYDKDTNLVISDYIATFGSIPNKTIRCYSDHYSKKYKTRKNFSYYELLQPMFINGVLVEKERTLDEIREFSFSRKKMFTYEQMRLIMPDECPIELSEEVYNTRLDLINKVLKS